MRIEIKEVRRDVFKGIFCMQVNAEIAKLEKKRNKIRDIKFTETAAFIIYEWRRK